MKTLLVFVWSVFAISALAQTPQQGLQEPQATYNDIRQTLGIVPTFLRQFPAEAIPGAWRDMKNVQLSNETALSGKIKELIGVAVASQIPCHYCTYFHTEAAKLNNATQREISEALAAASITWKWSTVINGSGQSFDSFKGQMDKSIAYMKERSKQVPQNPPSQSITTVEEAFRDMERTMGLVPHFLRVYPTAGVIGAWREYKEFSFGKTALSSREKELIGLAVAAQIPCAYCVYAHTESAKMNGATENEIRDTLAIAATTRHWSTFLNGIQMEESAFRKEVQQIMQHLKAQKVPALGKKTRVPNSVAVASILEALN